MRDNTDTDTPEYFDATQVDLSGALVTAFCGLGILFCGLFEYGLI